MHFPDDALIASQITSLSRQVPISARRVGPGVALCRASRMFRGGLSLGAAVARHGSAAAERTGRTCCIGRALARARHAKVPSVSRTPGIAHVSTGPARRRGRTDRPCCWFGTDRSLVLLLAVGLTGELGQPRDQLSDDRSLQRRPAIGEHARRGLRAVAERVEPSASDSTRARRCAFDGRPSGRPFGRRAWPSRGSR